MKKIHHFIVPANTFLYDREQQKISCTSSTIIHQIQTVLRISVGEKICIGIGDGVLYTIQIKTLEKNTVSGAVLEMHNTQKESLPKIHLYFSLLKKENTEFILQKCTELGIDAFHPIITNRTIKTGFPRERFEKIVCEASEQCGRGTIPYIEDPVEFQKLDLETLSFESVPTYTQKYICHTDARAQRQDSKNKDGLFSEKDSVAIFIGPEGGFTDTEISRAISCDISPLSLGTYILRGETACIVACAKFLA